MKAAAIAACSLMLFLAGCGGDSISAPTPTPTPSPTPTPTPTPTPSGQFVITSNIQYGSGAVASGSLPLRLDVYQPASACAAPRPAVLFVHGGGFVGGSRTGDNVEGIARDLTQRGINLVSIDYRLQGDAPVVSSEFAAFESDFQQRNTGEPPARVTAFVAAVEDALRALRWMEANAAAYCMDPARLGVWGSSAGAFTVLHLAYSLDGYAISRPGLRVAVDYWGGLFLVTDLEAGEPPLFVLHGTADSTVPFSRATEITTRADGVGVPLSFYTVTGGQHGYSEIGFFDLTVDGETLGAKTATFVDAHMRAGGRPVYERRTISR